MENLQKEIKKWAEEVIKIYEPIASKKENNISYYTQSDLTKITQSPDILILGINPGSEGAYDKIDAETFMRGNTYFSERDKWHLWRQLKKILAFGNLSYLIEDETRFVFTNVYHFGTLKAVHLSSELKNNENIVNLTISLIKDVLKPKRVLCLGKHDCFDKLHIKCQDLIAGELTYGKLNEIPVYGIPHTSSFYTNEESEMIGKVLSALFTGKIEPDKEKIAECFKDEIKVFEERKEQIKPDNISKFMIAEAFRKFSQLKAHEGMKDWYYLTNNIVVRVTDVHEGLVNFRHSNFEGKNNYGKSPQNYLHTQEIIEELKRFGYGDKDYQTSLGTKLFSQYKKSNPQEILLAIFQELNELKPVLEDIFKK